MAMAAAPALTGRLHVFLERSHPTPFSQVVSPGLPFLHQLLWSHPHPSHLELSASSHVAADSEFLGIAGNMDCILLRKSFML